MRLHPREESAQVGSRNLWSLWERCCIQGEKGMHKWNSGNFWSLWERHYIQDERKGVCINYRILIRLPILFQDLNSKNKFANQVGNYFSKMELWLSHIIKTPQSLSLATNIFYNVGLMFSKIPYLLYTKVNF